jgi:glyoxylase-like metal-dependent hydrolase (beta-lactamase superfamily II)
MEVAPGIHRVSGGIVNFYLLDAGGGLVLVDAGAPADWKVLVATLTGLGREVERLQAVVLTHAHSDHTGFAERARTTAGASISIHRADEQAARTGKTGKNEGKLFAYLLHTEFYRTAFSLVRRGAARVVPVADLSTFDDGETLDLPGRPRVVHAPGHTEGSCALFLEDRKALLTGDCLVTWNAFTGRVGPQIMPAGLNRDSAQALASLDALEKVPAELLLPGHGEPWRQSAADAVRLARVAGRS